jgi:predicted AlkP superfamily phosphohydrolase/phosphomutase
MIAIGVDGMDTVFVETHFASRPNLHRLQQQGGFRRLATTVPTQSPVAWSSVITGMGTPDMTGSFGTFSFYTRRPRRIHAC